MKKFYFFLLLSVSVATVSLGQNKNLEYDFDDWTDNSYGGIAEHTDPNGNQWETNNTICGPQNARSGNAIRFNDDSSSDEYLLFKGVDGNGKDNGLGTISFWFRHWNADGSSVKFQTQYNQNGAGWTNIGPIIVVTSDSYTEFSESVNLSGDNILIRVVSIEDDERLLIDDFLVTDYSNGSPPDPEPSNHVSSFSAAENGSAQIDFSWNDNDGVQAAAAFLIKGSEVSFAAITDPTDGTAEADGGLVLNVASGAESATIASLSASTTYYFKIYPYTNAGSDIDYKTDGTIPNASATTEEAPSTISYFEDFDTEERWDGGSMNSYNAKTYKNDENDPEDDTFSTDAAVRESSNTNSGAYAWRVDDLADAYLMYECNVLVTEFSVYAARWDNSPKPNVSVEYSTNSGTDWTTISTFNGDEFTGDRTYKKLTFNSFGAVSPEEGEVLQIRFRTISGERMLYDDFEVIYEAISTTPGLWTGAVSNDWFDTSNWDDGNEPTAATDVVIPTGASNYPTITSAAECNSITIKSTLNSDASLIGQQNLSVSGTINLERNINGYTSEDNGWHFISSPINNMTIVGSDFEPTAGTDDLFRWGETVVADEKWLNFIAGTFGHAQFETGLGYLVAYLIDDVKVFSGSQFNPNSVTKNLTYTADGGEGWNLAGNPYPSGLDWNLIDKSAGNIGGSFYVVNPADGSYKSSNGSGGDFPNGHIPPHQGFFVQVSANTTITMETSDQVHTSNGFEKQANTLQDYLVVELSGAESSNATYFHFRDDATNQFDFHADALKLFGWATTAQVYSEIEGDQYSINCLPHSEEVQTVPVAIAIQSDESLSLNFSGASTFANTVKIELEDQKLGYIQDIMQNPSYAFDASVEDNPNRFRLHFSGVTGIDDMSSADNINVYTIENKIYINTADALSADILVYDISGKLLLKDSMDGTNLKRIDMKSVPGVYLISLVAQDATVTKKVYLK
jgi:hypothetical protein